MHARQCEPHLDGYPGNGVVQLWSQAVRPCQRRACVLVSPFVECNARCRRARQSARRVVPDAGLLDDRLCRLRESCCLTPSSLLGRDQRELCVCQVGLLDGAERRSPLDHCGEVVRRTIRCTEQRVRNASRQERDGGPDTVGRKLVQCPIGDGRAPARHRPSSCAHARWRPRGRSWRCRLRAGSPRLLRRPDRASARPLPAGPSVLVPRLRRRRARDTAPAPRR